MLLRICVRGKLAPSTGTPARTALITAGPYAAHGQASLFQFSAPLAFSSLASGFRAAVLLPLSAISSATAAKTPRAASAATIFCCST